MSLSAILEAILSTGQAQLTEIENEAYTRARLILATSQTDAKEKHEQACTAILLPAYRERARLLHSARLEGLHIIGEARENLIDKALSQSRGRLASFRNHPAYPQVLQKLVYQALEELQASLSQSGKVELQADPRDQALIQNILQPVDAELANSSASLIDSLDLTVSYDLTCWGGVIAQSLEDNVVVINTLETRLERAIPYMRRWLSAYFERDEHA